MNFKIVKLNQLSGNKASIYSVFLDDEQKTLYERFLNENINLFKSEIINITSRLKTIGSKTGAIEDFFKHGEGDLGDGVCALYDIPKSKLRLYCIRYGSSLIIIGGGGPKPKYIRKLQDDKKLKDENFLLRDISKLITERIKEKEIHFSFDETEIIGNLEFNSHE